MRFLFLTAVTLVIVGCSTSQPTVAPIVTEAPKTTESAPLEPLPQVTPHPDVITIAEAIALLNDPSAVASTAKHHGYKMLSNYGVYRLDNYSSMLYKNCKPAKLMGNNVYEDMPLPLRKGTSSYVAIKDDVTIGVFNAKAYTNLTEQLLAAGFRLVSEGHETEYTNGTHTAYCYASRKTIRIEK